MAASSAPVPDLRRNWAAPVLYALMLGCTVGGFLLIRQVGQAERMALPAVVQTGPAATSAAGSELLLHVLLALAAVIVAGQGIGWLFRRMHQPPVIGEVIAGIILGPSLLGYIAPDVYAFLLPMTPELDIRPILSVVAHLGVVMYMFLVGMELDAGELARSGRTALAISHASIAAPFLMGGGLALWIYPHFGSGDSPFVVFALFLAISLSVTAFPVLARILSDRGMTQSPLGVLAISSAAIGDATAWCLLAFVVGVAQSEVAGVAAIIGWTGVFLAAMFVVVRPLVMRWIAWQGSRPLSNAALGVALLGLIVSSLMTEWIGIHAIFGAFAFGACIPHDSSLAAAVKKKLESVVLVLFLPAFFAFAGMRTNIGLISGLNAWLVCGVIILAASAGKIGGTLAAARLAGQTWRDSLKLGVLMNTRGLMELIVLNVGLDLKIISPTMFTMLVFMALVTTVATTPLLQLVNHFAPAEDSSLQHA